MHIDVTLMEKDLRRAGELAAGAEAAGHSGVWCTEAGVDPFLQAYEAVRSTEKLQVGTAIAVALARTPMTVAYSAWGLAHASQGRFALGLGSQVKAHIERRYSMPWINPTAQMREFVLATRAIFSSWRTGERLNFEGEFYRHTLMSPFWVPAPHEYEIPILLAAVGPRMMQMAGEVADGVLLHTFTTPQYLEKVAYPAIAAGSQTAGRDPLALQLSIPLFMAMGDTEEELSAMRADVARQLAFYASTPAYRPVLELAGYDGLQPELTKLSKEGRWSDMTDLVDDELIDLFSISGTPEQMPDLARAHLGDRVGRVTSYFGWPVSDPDRLSAILASFTTKKGAA
ncbi:probable F420-dependent oxidoreductase [Jatrophihabitans sp. GAS493]|uniref:TIGR03617 family F420-dependent LLM class oxidoreductase n=1 Tax=Jatrophihabitans sp. GAS493 TaxID=1907575 RepID=UPI000BBFDCA6|nr:TIGR03617 family F420-dependent LLM class oxidoreductase [Jatrophihabitans sp. GAS493]SOD74670.1 probable F420-dependent oxidoreductase [Jatrophihabitans sp. GAS493]